MRKIIWIGSVCRIIPVFCVTSFHSMSLVVLYWRPNTEVKKNLHFVKNHVSESEYIFYPTTFFIPTFRLKGFSM